MNMTRRPLPADALFALTGIDLKASGVSYDAQGRFLANVQHLALREGKHDFLFDALRRKNRGRHHMGKSSQSACIYP